MGDRQTVRFLRGLWPYDGLRFYGVQFDYGNESYYQYNDARQYKPFHLSLPGEIVDTHFPGLHVLHFGSADIPNAYISRSQFMFLKLPKNTELECLDRPGWRDYRVSS